MQCSLLSKRIVSMSAPSPASGWRLLSRPTASLCDQRWRSGRPPPGGINSITVNHWPTAGTRSLLAYCDDRFGVRGWDTLPWQGAQTSLLAPQMSAAPAQLERAPAPARPPAASRTLSHNAPAGKRFQGFPHVMRNPSSCHNASAKLQCILLL
jgi:hypothetical protein